MGIYDTKVSGYSCAYCGMWVATGTIHTCAPLGRWWIQPSNDPPHGQLPDCPDGVPPVLYRCKAGHWHPMPAIDGS